MPIYKLLNDLGETVNRIVATTEFMEQNYPDGTYEYDGEEPPPVMMTDKVYRRINKVEAIDLLVSVTGMSLEEELTFRKDPALELFWIKWREDVMNELQHDHPLTQQILDVLIATGYLTPEQRDELMDRWPSE